VLPQQRWTVGRSGRGGRRQRRHRGPHLQRAGLSRRGSSHRWRFSATSGLGYRIVGRTHLHIAIDD
jgi:hypothetical protein